MKVEFEQIFKNGEKLLANSYIKIMLIFYLSTQINFALKSLLLTKPSLPTSVCVFYLKFPYKSLFVRLLFDPWKTISNRTSYKSWVSSQTSLYKVILSLNIAKIEYQGFLDSSVGKESACIAGDPGSIPGLGRSTGEAIGYPLQCSWVSLVAQRVKNPPAMRETCVQSLGWEDPLEKGKAIQSSILAWRSPWIV